MEAIEQLLGSGAAISPSGDLLACVAEAKLKICYVQAPERTADFKIRLQSKDVSSIKWSDNNARVLLSSTQSVEVLDLDDEAHRIRLDNGSGGLGRFISADFVGNNHLLTTWEFGRAKLWDLVTGKGVELGEFKTKSEGRTWAPRPSDDGASQVLAFLSRAQAQDQVTIHFPSTSRTMDPTTISTADARNISWSPDSRWISVLDTAHAHPGLLILTPDGQPFRSYPTPAQEPDENLNLGIKAITWSSDSRLLAISSHGNTITLLNTKTFTPLAVVEHSTTIDQQAVAPLEQAIIWQESVSASNARTYATSPQPVSPPLSRAKPSTEPSDAGVAEARFSADGRYLATRDENMLSTVWIWDTSTLRAHAILIQHNNVRRMHWHSKRKDLLLLDCNDNIAYLFNASSGQPPTPIEATLSVTPLFSFAPSKSEHSKPVVLAATRTSFTLIFPEGKDEVRDVAKSTQQASDAHADVGAGADADGDMEDSLFEVLTGRTPAPAKTQPSYTEQVDLDADLERNTAELDDTFREKRKGESSPMPRDPLDDSEIF